MPFQTTFPLDWGQREQDEFSISFQSSRQYSKGQLKDHWHDCFEVLYITSGSRSFTAGQQSFLLEQGDILVLPPHLSHSSAGGVYECFVFGYAESVIHTPYNSYNGLKYLFPFQGAQALHLQGDAEDLCQLRKLIRRGAALYAGSTPTRTLEIHACILQVHAILWQRYLQGDSAENNTCRYLNNVQDYIEAHLTEDISPYEIAHSLHISHSHLCRIIKKGLRTTPASLINQYRLCLAQRLLLQHPELTVTQVALRCGFEDDSYFIRRFKKENGMTPGHFRTRYAQTKR